MLTEREAWRALVREANRLGHNGKRLTRFEVIAPNTAAGRYCLLIETDNGPTAATETW